MQDLTEGMPSRDYYADLELDRLAGVGAVTKAYRTLAKTEHPDRVLKKHPELSGEALGAEIAKATENFKVIQAAYEFLSNPDKKGPYDGQLMAEDLQVFLEWERASKNTGFRPKYFKEIDKIISDIKVAYAKGEDASSFHNGLVDQLSKYTSIPELSPKRQAALDSLRQAYGIALPEYLPAFNRWGQSSKDMGFRPKYFKEIDKIIFDIKTAYTNGEDTSSLYRKLDQKLDETPPQKLSPKRQKALDALCQAFQPQGEGSASTPSAPSKEDLYLQKLNESAKEMYMKIIMKFPAFTGNASATNGIGSVISIWWGYNEGKPCDKQVLENLENAIRELQEQGSDPRSGTEILCGQLLKFQATFNELNARLPPNTAQVESQVSEGLQGWMGASGEPATPTGEPPVPTDAS